MNGDRSSGVDARSRSVWSDRLSRYADRAGQFVFGDAIGLTLWLGVVLLGALSWRVGFFITDTYPIANAVANLADGRLAMTPPDFRYSLTLGTQPGLHEYGGRFYARNYGQVVAALPFLWLLEGASAVAPPRLVLAGGWALGVVGLGRRLAARFDRRWLRLVAVAVASAWFAAAVVLATALDRSQLPLVALQLSTLAAAGLVAVSCYRLVGAFHDRRVAVAAGVALALATPVGFWATIPKRHVLVTALVFGSAFAFARSRQLDGRASHVAHGLAYGALGLVAWVHAFEGFFLTAALFVVDVLTEPRKSRRRLAVVGGIFALSVLPMAVTNVLINGNPLRPPRLLPGVGPESVELAPTGGPESGGGDGGSGTAGGDADADSTSGDSTRPLLDELFGLLSPLFVLLTLAETVLAQLVFIGNYAVAAVSDGVAAASEHERLWEIFVRRGDSASLSGVNDYEPIDLSVVESTPIVGTLLALPAVAAVHLRRHGVAVSRLGPRRQTDLLVASYAVVLTLVYLPRLPLFSQLTVRYLLPAIALASYCPFRLPAVREAISGAPRTTAGVYAGTVLAGPALVAVVLGVLDPALGEAIQFHALLGLCVAAVAAVLVVGRTVAPDRVSPRSVAVGVALAGGATTVYLSLASVVYFAYGPFAFDVVGLIARLVPIL
ncbi:hypothetical protein [Halomicrobium katesii]|uniref:hypothetical protein n=1 Tax=Halomicrobium katesii TaxID=437163 RepID=UPI00037525C9|nr:hypothetical protein [Halomicrobium katesii]